VRPVAVDQTPDEVRAAVCETMLALATHRGPVLIGGKLGVGKSTVAAIVARAFPSWSWFGCDELLTTLMQCRSEGSVQRWDAQGYAVHTTEQQLLRRLEQVGLLVLDDVGTRTLTEPQAEALRRVLDARVDKALIVTTNCNTAGLDEHVGARNRSRLLAGCVVRIGGGDLRAEAALGAPPNRPPATPPGGCPQGASTEPNSITKSGGPSPPP
jgi:DNA replication protein DnaC